MSVGVFEVRTLTKISQEPPVAFFTSNSWGDYALSSEETIDGHVVTIRKKPQLFSKNARATVFIPSGEQMFYSIKLDDEWCADASLPISDQQPVPVTIKAMYEIQGTSQSAEQGVWTGRVQSSAYRFHFDSG